MQPMRSKKYPLSWQQARLWSLQQDKHFPLIQAAWQIHGLLHKRAFQQSLWNMMRRHDILRTTISHPPHEERPLQVVTSDPQLIYNEVNLEELKETEQMAVLDEAYLNGLQEIFDFCNTFQSSFRALQQIFERCYFDSVRITQGK